MIAYKLRSWLGELRFIVTSMMDEETAMVVVVLLGVTPMFVSIYI